MALREFPRHPHQESDFAKPILAKEGIAFAKFLAGITLLGFIAGLDARISPAPDRESCRTDTALPSP